MKQPDGQLRETLKILTVEYVSSVEKMCRLHKEILAHSRQQLFMKVFHSIEIQKKKQLIDEYVTLLENSQENPNVKRQYFQKDFDVHSSANNAPSSRIEQSLEEVDLFDHMKDESSGDKKSKQMVHRYTQTTHFYPDKNIIFFESGRQINQQSDDFVKKENLFFDEIEPLQIGMKEQSQEEDIQNSNSDYSQQNERSKYTLNHTATKVSTIRKKYRSYTQQQRLQAVKTALSSGIEFSSFQLNIPKKNITRWMKRSSKHQKIRGRKPINPNMQQNLNNWIHHNIAMGKYLTQSEIRNKAKIFSGDEEFKASKGWLEKYFRRNKLIGQQLAKLLQNKRLKDKKGCECENNRNQGNLLDDNSSQHHQIGKNQ